MQWWDIKNLKNKDFLLSLWGTLFLILPGIAAIAIFDQGMLHQLNWVVLIFLSASISFPFVVLNTIAINIWEGIKIQDKDSLFYSFFLSSLATGFTAYLGMAIGYWGHYTLGHLLIVATVVEILFALIVFSIDGIKESAEKRKKK